MQDTNRPRILCVDDEPNVVAGLALHLRRRYQVETAGGGADGLEALQRMGGAAVVITDMRMPGMNGATFLQHVRTRAPETVRVLLTGQTDLDAAIAAVNEGQIFRFLTKPCAPANLLGAIEAAVAQHALLTAEQELLEKTLHGSIKALGDVLALTSPVAFGRATRIKRQVTALANQLALRERWQVEVAAMVCELGCIALPAETVEKLHYGQLLSPEEKQMVARIPAVNEQLLASIPRLELVRRILTGYPRPFRPDDPGDDPQTRLVARGAHILRVALDFDALVAQGAAPSLALDTLRGRAGQYDPEVLAALTVELGDDHAPVAVRELTLAGLRVGMVLAEDVKLANGTLLVTRGYEVTGGFVERVRNFQPGAVREPVRVITAGKTSRTHIP